MTKPEVTAVGRLLKAKPGVPRVQKIVAIKPDGKVQTLISRPCD